MASPAAKEVAPQRPFPVAAGGIAAGLAPPPPLRYKGAGGGRETTA